VNVDNHEKTNWAKGFKVEIKNPSGEEVVILPEGDDFPSTSSLNLS